MVGQILDETGEKPYVEIGDRRPGAGTMLKSAGAPKFLKRMDFRQCD
ncbi:MAG: hypothetical protein ACTSRY_00050 [Alphaproteobacteria bacterium]